jgi:hypothetical protein
LIPGGVTGFFSNVSPSDCSVALGITQPLVKMSTRNTPGSKGGQCVKLTTSPPSCAECYEIWEPKPPGTLWAKLGLLQVSFTFYLHKISHYCPLVYVSDSANVSADISDKNSEKSGTEIVDGAR